jgi:Icc-related predicted phosphoesterase
MKIRYMSDLHNEKCRFFVPYEHDEFDPPNEKEEILILAGDVDEISSKNIHSYKFIKNVSDRFRKVIYVPGNHEFFHGSLVKSVEEFNSAYAHFENVHMLNKSSLIVDDVAFIGATLWSKVFDKSASEIGARLYDYEFIKYRNRKLKVHDTNALHCEHRDYIFSEIKKMKRKGFQKIIVITHHAPSKLSVNPKWAGHPLGDAFSTDLEELIRKAQPNLWFHGHMHDNAKYTIGETQVIANPRGKTQIIRQEEFDKWLDTIYSGGKPDISEYDFQSNFIYENPSFDPWASIVV